MQFFKIKNICQSLFIVLLSFNSNIEASLKNIKDTYSLLRPEYKHLSLIHGAVAWETGVIRRMYDFGKIEPEYQETNGRTEIVGYKNPETNHAVIRLIHLLFNRIPGSTSPSDFIATKQLTTIDVKKNAQKMASIIVACDKIKQLNLGTLKETLDSFTQTEKSFPRGIKQLALALKKEVKLSEITKKVKAVRTNDSDPAELTKLRVSLEIINNINPNLNGILRDQVRLGLDIYETLLAALNECDPINTESLYPEYTVEMILQAFVYKICEESREAMKAFYEELEKKLGAHIFLDNWKNSWTDQGFEPITKKNAFNIIKKNLAEKSAQQIMEAEFEDFVYYSQQIRGLIQPTSFSRPQYNYSEKKATQSFPDCMDTAMRNFINLFAYDVTSDLLNADSLQKSLGAKQEILISDNLRLFLNEFCLPSHTSTMKAHNRWLDVISDIPYVVYNHKVNVKSGAEERRDSENGPRGYIKFPQGDLSEEKQSILRSRKHELIDDDWKGYELKASVRNIIILLNHLLGLSLFEKPLSEEFFRPDFVTHYFPALCKRLGGDGWLSHTKVNGKVDSDIDFNNRDYSSSEKDYIYSTFSLNNIICNLETYDGHGVFNLVHAETSHEKIGLEKLLKQKLSDISNFSTLSLIATHITCDKDISLIRYLKENPQLLYLNFFDIPLEDMYFLNQTIRYYAVILLDSSLSVKSLIKDILLNCAKKQLTGEDLTNAINGLQYCFEIKTAILNMNNIQSMTTYHSFLFICDLITRNLGLEQILTICEEEALQQNTLPHYFLIFFRQLAEKNFGLDRIRRLIDNVGATDMEQKKILEIELEKARIRLIKASKIQATYRAYNARKQVLKHGARSKIQKKQAEAAQSPIN